MFWQFLILSILHHSVQSIKQYIHVNTRRLTFNAAEKYCLDTYKSHLLTINHRTELDQFLTQCMSDGSNCYGWIGLHDQATEGNLEWVDGSRCPGYHPRYEGRGRCVRRRNKWFPGFFKMNPTRALYLDCVYVRPYGGSGRLAFGYCHRRRDLRPFFCNPQDTAEDDPLDALDLRDKYIVAKSPNDRPIKTTWAGAQRYCERMYHSSLATITNKAELGAARWTAAFAARFGNQGVHPRRRQRPIYNFWIGLNDLSDRELWRAGQGDETQNVEGNEENVFTWIDGQTECDYNTEQNCGQGDLWCANEGAVEEDACTDVDETDTNDCVYLRTARDSRGSFCFDAVQCREIRYVLCNAIGTDYDGDAGGVLPFGDFGENYWLPKDPEAIPDDVVKPVYDNKWNLNVDLTSLLFGMFITLLIGNIIYWMNCISTKKKPHRYKSVSVDSSDTDA